jgi:NAD(P)-dependent dehydrogenase (short-subunit alcohol dehydrogenase family)
VTGGSRGIGRGIALALARAGHDVAVSYVRNEAAATEAVEELRRSGGSAMAVQADISVAADRERLLAGVVDRFGGVDLLVNNAGTAPPERVDILQAGEESFDYVLGVNLKGPYFLTQAVARQMIAQEPGPVPPAIVIVSSISAYTASVARGDYCVSKAGLSMTTALFAARLADHGIAVHEIRPGIIATDMTAGVKQKYDDLIEDGLTPIRRWGTPDDVARAVVAVASGLLPFSTGQVIDVDGGFHLRTL